MKYHPNVEQGSLDWLTLHIGRITASGIDNMLTPEWKLRTGETPRTYVYRKAAEAWRKAPILSAGSWSTEQGLLKEDEAMAFAGMEYGYHISKMGFCESDDGISGCSPDGLVGEHSGVEMKCPEPANQVRYLCERVVPKDYVAQVHGSMFVTGRPEWVFFSYARGFPPLHLVVKRDEAIQAKIASAVQTFKTMLDEAMEKLNQSKL